MDCLGGWISKGKKHVSDQKPAEIANSWRNRHWKCQFLQNGQLKMLILTRRVAEIHVLSKESAEIMVFMTFPLEFSMKNQVFLWISRFFIWKTRFFYEKTGFSMKFQVFYMKNQVFLWKTRFFSRFFAQNIDFSRSGLQN